MVELAVERKPFKKPSVVEVELPQDCGVNGNALLPEAHAPLVVVKSPPVEACTQLPDVRPDTLRLPFMVEEAVTIIPFLTPLTKLGKIKEFDVLVMLHGTEVVAKAVIGTNNKVARNSLSKVFIIRLLRKYQS